MVIVFRFILMLALAGWAQALGQGVSNAEPLAFDAMTKRYDAKVGEVSAPFTFGVTNTSSANVVVNYVRPSCGCTAAKLPPTPWTLKPGESGVMEFNVDLRGKYGQLSKYVTVDTSAGIKLLNIQINIPVGGPSLGAAGEVDARTRNMQLASADRQVVFRGECASCHSTPTVGKHGEALYQAACAICHDAPHRATMVPDLHALKQAPTREYWQHWITYGKPGSLMPAFTQNLAGPLNQQQIDSLVEYMTHYFPPRPRAASLFPSLDD